jgi:hypothetical protein
LIDLIAEQEESAVERARADKLKVSATWMAKGDHLVLLIVNASNLMKPKKTTYKCRLIDVTIEPQP